MMAGGPPKQFMITLLLALFALWTNLHSVALSGVPLVAALGLEQGLEGDRVRAIGVPGDGLHAPPLAAVGGADDGAMKRELGLWDLTSVGVGGINADGGSVDGSFGCVVSSEGSAAGPLGLENLEGDAPVLLRRRGGEIGNDDRHMVEPADHWFVSLPSDRKSVV